LARHDEQNFELSPDEVLEQSLQCSAILVYRETDRRPTTPLPALPAFSSSSTKQFRGETLPSDQGNSCHSFISSENEDSYTKFVKNFKRFYFNGGVIRSSGQAEAGASVLIFQTTTPNDDHQEGFSIVTSSTTKNVFFLFRANHVGIQSIPWDGLQSCLGSEVH
jgi:hypothetical protein